MGDIIERIQEWAGIIGPNIYVTLDFELLCWIDPPVDRGRINHELNCAVYKAFAVNEIAIPFPTREPRISSVPASLEKS